MTTAIAQKTNVEAKWNTQKIQEEASGAFARMWMASLKTVETMGPEGIKMLAKHVAESKMNYYKSMNVKTPIDLVKAIAEFETNVFGSKIQIWGDDTKAHLDYQVCGCFDAFTKMGKDPKKEEIMGQVCSMSNEIFAKEMGMKVEMKMGEPLCTMTFSK